MNTKKLLFIIWIIFFISGCVELETNIKSNPDNLFRRKKLSEVKTWLYQLQNINLRKVADSYFDLVVTDYSKEGDEKTEYRNGQIKNFKRVSGKIIISYISIGEAEDYRFYWNNKWKKDPPVWLDAENPDWEGNYKVKYWYKEWQKIIFSYLDRIIEEGFDGVYLDIIDAYNYYQKERPKAKDEMINFVREIAYYCREKKGLKDFLIFPQNAPELVTNKSYLDVISGIGQEETYFKATDIPSEDTEYNEKYLDIVKQSGKLVLTVDYCNKPENIKKAYKRAREKGYVEYCTVVDLDKMILFNGINSRY